MRRDRVARSTAAAEAATGLAPHTIGGKVVPAKESDTEAAKAKAEKFAQKKTLLEELREKAVGPDLAPLRWSIDQKLRHLTKSHYAAKEEGDLVVRYLQAAAEEEAQQRDRAREERRQEKAELAKQKAIQKRLRNEKDAAKLAQARARAEQQAAAAEERRKQALIERDWALHELEDKGSKSKKEHSRENRLLFLARLRVVYGVSDAVAWYFDQFCEWYVDWICRANNEGAAALYSIRASCARGAAKAKTTGVPSQVFDKWVQKNWALQAGEKSATCRL